MKKYLTLAAALLLTCACQGLIEEPAPVADGWKTVSISAAVADLTKTSYTSTGAFSWSPGDEISVWCSDAFYTFSTYDSGTTATFTGTIPSGASVGNVALFPASSGHSYESYHYYFNVDEEKSYIPSDGSHASADIPMYGTLNSGGGFSFTHLCGAAKLVVTGFPSSITKVKVSFTASATRMNGPFKVYNGDGYCTWNPENSSTDSDKLYIRYCPVQDGTVTMYIPYAEGTIWGYSKLKIENATTGEELYKNDMVNNIPIVRRQILPLTPITLSIEDPGGTDDPEVPVDPQAINLSFTQTDAKIANPERGMYDMIEYRFNNGGSWPSAKVSMSHANSTLVLAEFYMFDFVLEDHIPQNALTLIDNIFGAIRTKGKKAIVRFAYSDTHPADHQEPTKEQLLNHISELAPYLAKNEDIIYVVQAGFIGAYGEWYYTTNFDGSNHRDYTISGNTVTGFENRSEVLGAILDAVPESRQVALRTPLYKRCHLNPKNLSYYAQISGPGGTDDNSRLSFHNDAFLADKSDMGTFKQNEDRPMWKSQSAWLAVGGETPYGDYTFDYGDTMEEVEAAIYDYHYSYLHESSDSRLMAWWMQQSGWMDRIEKMLGYRLYLESASISHERASGSELTVSFKLSNSGAAPVINERPMKLVLLRGGSPTVLAEDFGDVRTVASRSSKTFTATVTLPVALTAGDKLALWLPDASEGLRSKPAYSIRLANNETSWSNGYNVFYTF